MNTQQQTLIEIANEQDDLPIVLLFDCLVANTTFVYKDKENTQNNSGVFWAFKAVEGLDYEIFRCDFLGKKLDCAVTYTYDTAPLMAIEVPTMQTREMTYFRQWLGSVGYDL